MKNSVTDSIYNINSFSFIYSDSSEKVLNNINITIRRGEFVVICGESGCGKTTLLKNLKTEVQPSGQRMGKIYYDEQDIRSYDMQVLAGRIGYVSQEADSQLVTDMVWHELAFGLENMGFDNQSIRKRVAECASFFGIQHIFNKKTNSLSGGQKQLVNLASVMVMRPDVIILDEPTSQLDPISAAEFISVLGRINRESGTTIIMTEHRLEDVFELCSRVVVMSHGKVISDEGVNEAARISLTCEDNYAAVSAAMPAAIRVSGALGEKDQFPLSVADGRRWLTEWMDNKRTNNCNNKRCNEHSKETSVKMKHRKNDMAVQLNDIWFRYKDSKEDVLKGLNINISKGTIYAVNGGNGTGKSTLLSVIAGIDKQYRGKVKIAKGLSPAYIPQRPELLFTADTVEKELETMFISNTPLFDSKLKDTIKTCCLEHLLTRNPFDLSGGEKQRTALAKILLSDNDIILLDEPSKGMDALFKQKFGYLLKELCRSGKTILLVSHDIEFCAEFADNCGMLFDGIITAEGETKQFFLDNSYYTTQVVKITRDIVDGCVTVDDVVNRFTTTDTADKVAEDESIETEDVVIEEVSEVLTDKPKRKYTWCISLIYLIMIPLTVWAGNALFTDRKYYFISLLIVLESIIPFFISFEKSRPGIKKIVVIAVMCAICVAGRQAFYMLPGCKPVVALVIISGIALGAEAGFVVGSMTMLVSNMFFGQGPWTPWQMLAMGVVGLISGILFYRTNLDAKKHKFILSIAGVLISLIIYSGIVNMCMPLTTQVNININMIIAAYISGLPFDLLQAFTTALILFLIADPMIKRIRRVMK